MSAGGSLQGAVQPPYWHGGGLHTNGGVAGKVLYETTRPFDGSSPIDAGNLPLLVQHSSSLQTPQPAGHLIPTNVRPPQCLAAAAVGSAYIPSALTGSPFFHAAPSAPPCVSRNPQAPTLAALTHRLGAPGAPGLLGDSELGAPDQHQQQGGGFAAAAGGPSGSTPGGSEAAEGVCWPPPNTVSVGYGNIRNQMEAAGAGLPQNNCVLGGNSNKAFSVISIPNQQAALYNRAAEELSRSLKAMGCYAAKKPAAASLSKQLLFAKQQSQSQRKPRSLGDENAEAAAAAAAEAERQQREAEEAAARAQEEEEQQQQQNLDEIDVSQLLCLAGPSPAQLREMRAKEAQMWRQQQQQMEYQQQQQQRRFFSGEDYCRQQQQQQQHEVQDSWSEGDAAPAYFENPVNEYGQQTDRDYLREQILLQEERIAQLHEQLMQHQQAREQRRQEAATAAAAAAAASGEGEARCGFFLREENHVASKADIRQRGQQQQQQEHELVRRASGSTKWSSRQSSDDRPKTVDCMLEAYLSENGLSPSLFRRVRSGVYFYGKTKLVMKIQRGQLSCMALHLTHEQQQTQQARFVCIDRFLKEQGALKA
ncbi:hypothetical protein Esti_005213 [Eimeria stiedai]